MAGNYDALFERYLEFPFKPTTDGWNMSFCPFHEQGGKGAGHKTASFAFNSDSGGWKCFGCSKAGNAIDFAGLNNVSSYDPSNKENKKEARILVNSVLPWFEVKGAGKSKSSTKKGSIPDPKEIEFWNTNLLKDAEAMLYLANVRNWSSEVITKHKIGISTDRKRFTIPIYLKGDLVNVRYYSPKGSNPWKEGVSKIRGIMGRNEVRIYPDSVLSEDIDKVFLVEGESDVLAALSIGLNAVTFTGGAGNVPVDLRRLSSKEIAILYDNDEAGIKGAKKVAQSLRRFTQRIKVLDFSSIFAESGFSDLTDAVVGLGSAESLKMLLDAEKSSDFQSSNAVRHVHIREVGFDEAINSSNIGAKIRLKAMVMGTRERPYASYSRVVADCKNAGSKAICGICPLNDGSASYPLGENDRLTEKEILSQVRKSEFSLLKELKKTCGFMCDDFELNAIRSTIESIYELVVGPYHEDSGLDESIGFQQRTVFACNSGKQYRINQPYLFEGVTVPQPWDQANTHVFTHHEEIERTVDGFELTEEDKERLRIFCT